MNDKWNPRLWLRDWLNKASKTEVSDRERFQADLADFHDGDASASAAARKRLETAGFNSLISVSRLTLDAREGRCVGLKALAPQPESHR